MLGRHSPQRELYRPDNALLAHVGSETFFGFLSREGPSLFLDEDYSDLYRSGGRPSVPPSLLCVLLVLQAHAGVSDEEAIERTAFDLRWKVALGVELEDKLCAKSTLQLFRSKLILNERFAEVFEKSVDACRKAGLVRPGKVELAIDTTPVLGRGAVKDTFNLVSEAIRKVVVESSGLKGWVEADVVAEHGLGRHFAASFKGSVELDWSDEAERRALVAQLVADAHVALSLSRRALNGYAGLAAKSAGLREARDLLVELLAQDIDEDPEDGGGPTIARRTVKDRIISANDPQMRHGHKSHSKGFNGYKASVVVDTKSGVILATDARGANVPDRHRAGELIDSAGRAACRPVERVLGDTAYGDMETRSDLAARGIEVLAKAPPAPRRRGTFGHEAFQASRNRVSMTCPAGKRSLRRDAIANGWKYIWSRNDCNACELRSACTTSKVWPRTVSITETTLELNRLRRKQRTARFRRRYRRRVVVEHRIGRLKQLGIAKARYFGLTKTAFQVALAATVANLAMAAAALLPLELLEALIDVLRRIGAAERPNPKMATCRPDL